MKLVGAFFLILIWVTTELSLASESYQTAFMSMATAPNAGGQTAYAIRRGYEDGEWSVFSNQYLKAGDYPLSGALYSARYTICGKSCPVQFFGQAGLGLTTAGPLLEILWSVHLIWLARLDFASHFYLTEKRVVVWNYPFWVGVSFPF